MNTTTVAGNQFEPGDIIEYRGELWEVVRSLHVKPGKGSAFVRLTLRNLVTESMLEQTFRASERLTRAYVQKVEAEYLYRDLHWAVLRCVQSNEIVDVDLSLFGSQVDLLIEGQGEIILLMHNSGVLRAILPNRVALTVSQTPPDMRGNTAQGGYKTAVLVTGASIKVPFHIQPGDTIEIDTRTHDYLRRLP